MKNKGTPSNQARKIGTHSLPEKEKKTCITSRIPVK